MATSARKVGLIIPKLLQAEAAKLGFFAGWGLSPCPCRYYHYRRAWRHVEIGGRSLSSSSTLLQAKEVKKPILKKNERDKPVVEVWKNMTVSELARTVDRDIDQVFEAMIYVKNADDYDSPKSEIDNMQVIRDIAKTLGKRTKVITPEEKEGKGKTLSLDIQPRPVVEKDLVQRHPVVAIMGHVDHGKTTLLDALRKTNVAAGEAGGITQHIGAFVVKTSGGNVTFLDTPGHAAFSALRQRGANGADLVILVVAADDGVMEQTRESIRMIREAGVPMIIAINKIDKGTADIDKTKRMLLQESIQLEDFGGDVQSVAISASKGTNLSSIVDAILAQAELLNLKSEGKGMIEGVVLESSVDPGRGRLCTALVQRGALRRGAILVAGTAWAKVRGMFDEYGEPLHVAGPSTPVEVIGWRELPNAGDRIYEVESERFAKSITEHRQAKEMEEKGKADAVVIEQKHQEHLKDYKAMLAEKRRLGRFRLKPTGPREKMIKDDGTIRLPVVIKADVDGSVEALLDVLETYDCHDQCRLDLVHYGVGDITETDIKLAETFGGFIYGFNVNIPEDLKAFAKKNGIEFRLSNVIYRIIEAMKIDISERLPPNQVEEVVGEGSVLAVFKVTEGKKKVSVAGSRCTKGVLKRDALFRIVRGEGEIVSEGKVHSMRHLKNEVDSVKNGVECGLAFDDVEYTPQDGDHIICYTFADVPQTSKWDPGF